jgi:hypothetical protein
VSAEIVEILTPVGTLEVTAPASTTLEVSTVSTTLEVTNVSPILEVTTPASFVLEITSPMATAATFESLAQNVGALNVLSTSFVEGVSLIKTFDSSRGTTITVTLLFDVEGLPSTKTLSGTGLPPGIATVCTYDFTGREIPLKTYT